MCGRYFIDVDSDMMIRLFERIKETHPQLDLSSMAKNEVFPTQLCLTLTGAEQLQPKLMKWGYPKWDGKGVIINARSEGILQKPMFRHDVLSNRCLVVSSGFYEWDANKKRHTIRGEEEILYMAGVYQEKQGEAVFAIVTKASTGAMKEIHDRSPILLRRKDIMVWQSANFERLLRTEG